MAAYPNDRTIFFDGGSRNFGMIDNVQTQFSSNQLSSNVHPDTEGAALMASDIAAAIRYFEGTLAIGSAVTTF